MSEFRIRRRRRHWIVQEFRHFGPLSFWRWIGPFGIREKFTTGREALWFANLCERVDAREAAKDQPK